MGLLPYMLLLLVLLPGCHWVLPLEQGPATTAADRGLAVPDAPPLV